MKLEFIFDVMSIPESFIHNRHSVLREYQSICSIGVTSGRSTITKYEVLTPRLEFFFPSFAYAMPLPQISNEWGVAQLILRFKLPMLLNLLLLLLLERSVLIIGENSEDVSSCAFALLDLLKPYKWSSIFLPSLSEDMIDFISSPVPFIAVSS